MRPTRLGGCSAAAHLILIVVNRRTRLEPATPMAYTLRIQAQDLVKGRSHEAGSWVRPNQEETKSCAMS